MVYNFVSLLLCLDSSLACALPLIPFDTAREVQGECRAELARALLSRSLHSPLQLLVCNGKGTKFIFGFASSCKLLQIVAIFSVIFFVFLDYFLYLCR